jgi:hypothetical protein
VAGVPKPDVRGTAEYAGLHLVVVERREVAHPVFDLGGEPPDRMTILRSMCRSALVREVVVEVDRAPDAHERARTQRDLVLVGEPDGDDEQPLGPGIPGAERDACGPGLHGPERRRGAQPAFGKQSDRPSLDEVSCAGGEDGRVAVDVAAVLRALYGHHAG